MMNTATALLALNLAQPAPPLATPSQEAPDAQATTTTYTCQTNIINGTTAFTMTCTPAGGTPPSGGQAVMLLAPNQVGAGQTQLGNYATGCSASPGAAAGPNRSCLMFDDHWDGTGTSSSTSALNLSHWSPGIYGCNGGATQDCHLFGGQPWMNISLPLTAWCNFGPIGGNGCHDSAMYPFPYGMGNYAPIAGIDTSQFHPMERAADGSLVLGIKYYFPQDKGTNNGTQSFCFNSSCQYLNWIGAGLAIGAIDNNSHNVTYTNGLIPASGGMMQWRMKLDDGVMNGAYGVMQCAAVGGNYPGQGTNPSNANWEFGYLSVSSGGGVPDPKSFGNGQNDTAVQTSQAHSGNNYVTTGNINPDGSTPAGGQGFGDTRNWHVYALEWVNRPAAGAPSGSGQWFYYVDGVSQSVAGLATSQGGYNNIAHVETRVPTTGWQCNFTHNMAIPEIYGGWHSVWNPSNPGGPWFMWISDVQIWKKPTG